MTPEEREQEIAQFEEDERILNELLKEQSLLRDQVDEDDEKYAKLDEKVKKNFEEGSKNQKKRRTY